MKLQSKYNYLTSSLYLELLLFSFAAIVLYKCLHWLHYKYLHWLSSGITWFVTFLSLSLSLSLSLPVSLNISILWFSLNLSLLANYRSQLLLDCLGRCIKLFVSTDSTSSQFGLAVFIYAREKHTKAIAKSESRASVFWMRRSRSIDRQRQHER